MRISISELRITCYDRPLLTLAMTNSPFVIWVHCYRRFSETRGVDVDGDGDGSGYVPSSSPVLDAPGRIGRERVRCGV